MSYYVGRALAGRLRRLERVLDKPRQAEPEERLSDEELADRIQYMLAEAEYVQAMGLDDAYARETIAKAAQIKAILTSARRDAHLAAA